MRSMVEGYRPAYAALDRWYPSTTLRVVPLPVPGRIGYVRNRSNAASQIFRAEIAEIAEKREIGSRGDAERVRLPTELPLDDAAVDSGSMSGAAAPSFSPRLRVSA